MQMTMPLTWRKIIWPLLRMCQVTAVMSITQTKKTRLPNKIKVKKRKKYLTSPVLAKLK
jgi:hypothetical protein